MELDNVIFKLDANVVLDSFNKSSNDLSYFYFIIKYCISSFNSFYPNSLIEFSRK
jgi:hypothetical protein